MTNSVIPQTLAAQSAALAEIIQYRQIFLGQVRAGWLWAHEP